MRGGGVHNKFLYKGPTTMKMIIKPTKITHSMLLDMAKRAKCDHERTIFLHYTWGAYGDIYDEFHLCIDKNGEIYRPRLNLDDSLSEWGFLDKGIHIALCCGKNLRYSNSGYQYDKLRRVLCGDYPTELQIAQMAIVVAIICRVLGQEICYRNVKTLYEHQFANIFRTHNEDISRDLMWLPHQEHSKELDCGGVTIRSKALEYLQNFVYQKLLAPKALPPVVQTLFAEAG